MLVRYRAVRAGYLVSLVALWALLIVGCASEEEPAPAPTASDEPAAAVGGDDASGKSLIANAGRTYTVDDLVAIGWKKSDQLSAETLNHATEVWYGFYQQKDIEVRVYASHEDAKQYGAEPAKATIDADPGARGGDHGPWTPRIARYGAYGVVGNMVILCELEISPCESIAEALK